MSRRIKSKLLLKTKNEEFVMDVVEDIIEATGSEDSGETGDLDSEGESGESERVEKPDDQDEADKETSLPDDSDNTDVPSTGDETNLMLWVVLMAVSGRVIFKRRKFA